MRCGGVGGTAERATQVEATDEREAQEHEAPERDTQRAAPPFEVHAEPAADSEVQVEPEVHARNRRRKRSLSCSGVSLSCSGVSASKTTAPQDAGAPSHSEVRAETGGVVTLCGRGGLDAGERCGSEVRADASEVHQVELQDLEPGNRKELDSCATCFVRHMRLSEYLDIWRLLGTMSAYVCLST